MSKAPIVLPNTKVALVSDHVTHRLQTYHCGFAWEMTQLRYKAAMIPLPKAAPDEVFLDNLNLLTYLRCLASTQC